MDGFNKERIKFLNTLFGGLFFVISGWYITQTLNAGGQVFQTRFGDPNTYSFTFNCMNHLQITYSKMLEDLNLFCKVGLQGSYFIGICFLIFFALYWSGLSIDKKITGWPFLAYFVGWACICTLPIILWQWLGSRFTQHPIGLLIKLIVAIILITFIASAIILSKSGKKREDDHR